MMKNIIKLMGVTGKGYFIMFFFFGPMFLYGQQPGLGIRNTSVCGAPSVLVSLVGTNLTNIGAITLFVKYNNQSMSFKALENIDPQLNELVFNVLTDPPRVAIVWSNLGTANFNNKKLLDIRFDVVSDTGSLSFMPNCEIANINLEIIPVNYTGGNIYPGWPTITTQPSSQKVNALHDVSFNVVSPDATNFTWQESRTGGSIWSDLSDGLKYNGSGSAILSIKNVTLSYNNFKYRCKVKRDSCPLYTSEVLLSVDSISGVNEGGLANHAYLKYSPNPFTGSTTITYNVPVQGSVLIELFSMTGQCLGVIFRGEQAGGEYKLENCFVYLQGGMYFCRYEFASPAMNISTFSRVIKI